MDYDRIHYEFAIIYEGTIYFHREHMPAYINKEQALDEFLDYIQSYFQSNIGLRLRKVNPFTLNIDASCLVRFCANNNTIFEVMHWDVFKRSWGKWCRALEKEHELQQQIKADKRKAWELDTGYKKY